MKMIRAMTDPDRRLRNPASAFFRDGRLLAAAIIPCACLALWACGDASVSALEDKTAAEPAAPVIADRAGGSREPRFSASIREGILRVHLRDPGSDEDVLIRSAKDPRTSLGADEEREIVSRERASWARWQACKNRLALGPPTSGEETHDALLETVENLEDLHLSDESHLGVLRDLLTACVQLLIFERETGLGANICSLASRYLRDFDAIAEPADRILAQRLRAWILLVMGLHPLAAEAAAAARGEPDVESALKALGQDKFEEAGGFEAGRLAVRVVKSAGKPPDPNLLWADTYFLATPPREALLCRNAACTLSRRGTDGREKWYLCFLSFNRVLPIVMYGGSKPTFEEVRARVARFFAEAAGSGERK